VDQWRWATCLADCFQELLRRARDQVVAGQSVRGCTRERPWLPAWLAGIGHAAGTTDPLLAKHSQDVLHRPWPGTERSQCPPESGNVQACWCRWWGVITARLLGFQRTRSRSSALIILEN